jgi:hypothetical protein
VSIAGVDGLALAGVNGTILAIVVAGLTGLFFLSFQTLDRMQTELIEEANRVNSKRPRVGWEFPPFSTDGLGIARLRRLFMVLAHGMEREEEMMGGGPLLPHIDLPPQDDLVARGRALSRVMAAAVDRYPFVANEPPYEPPYEPLEFNDLPSILEWFPVFDGTLRSFSGNLRNTREYVARLAAAADEAAADLKERYAESVKANSPIGLESTAYQEQRHLNSLALTRFNDFVEASSEIAQATRTRLDALERYRRRFPSRALVLAAISVVLVSFTCGVAIPMIHPTINSAVDAWVPVALYALSLGVGTLLITRHYQRSI